MIEIKQDTYKGTRILIGNQKRHYIDKMVSTLLGIGFTEIIFPCIQPANIFSGKVGDENSKMMFKVEDKSDRDLVLAPEYTAVIQNLAKTVLKHKKDVKLFYVSECFRGEKPQNGRYRQFTQLGVEILNPSHSRPIWHIAEKLVSIVTTKYEINHEVTRGLDYYEGGKGFEITCNELGSSKQVCGGGRYDGGEGFAIGIDRLIKLKK